MAESVRVHHCGITVSNLERAVDWYSTAFGLKPGLILEVSGPSGEKVLRMPPHTHRAALLPVGNFAIELLEFIPKGKDFSGRQDDVGYVYLCFEVDDLDGVYERMSQAGYDFHTPPMIGEEGQISGSKFCVMRDPDGKTIEFIETGPGMTAEALHKASEKGVRYTSFEDPLVMDG